MLWIALAVMTGLAMFFVLWPLGARARREDPREADFYRAQLAEIVRDVERGTLPAAEAAAARAEAGRRLLAVEAASAAPAASGALGRRRVAALATFVVVPALALAVYLKVGAPDLPDAPLAERRFDINAPGALEAAVAKIEAHLAAEPSDQRGWELVAPVYMRMGRFSDAADAYVHLESLGQDDAALHAARGEALVAAAGGAVTADARAELQKAPDLAMARFYLALALEQDGKTAQALDAYKALAPQAKGEAPWMAGLRARLAALGAPAPDVQPAFSAGQRQMIEGMVKGLADRLAANGGSAEEWGRLIRAYSVLHEPDKAREALASARKALGQNPDIDALASELRL